MAEDGAKHMTAAASRPLVYGYGGDDEPPARDLADAADPGENPGTVPVTILTGFLGSG